MPSQVNICKANMRLEACVRTGEPAHIVESFEQLLQYKVSGRSQKTKKRAYRAYRSFPRNSLSSVFVTVVDVFVRIV